MKENTIKAALAAALGALRRRVAELVGLYVEEVSDGG